MDDFSVLDALNIRCIRIQQTVSCKKRAIELVSELLASELMDSIDQETEESAIQSINITAQKIFNGMMEREKISATTIGNGIAIPNACSHDFDKIRVAMVTLDEAIDFDSPDESLVDVVLGFIFPIDDCDGTKRQLMHQLMEDLRQPGVVDALRQATSEHQALDVWLSLGKR